MATTTNFGWETPDDTDLVKDGAAAMRTLGNSIDTSFVDLKGGTSGQMLTKASNTDLDYTWVTPEIGDITAITASSPLTGGGTTGAVTVGILDATTSNKGAVQLSTSTSSTSTSLAATASAVKSAYDLADAAIPKSLIDAAGDLIVGTADNTAGRLAKGTAGQVLQVNSGATALEWASPSSGGGLTLISTSTPSGVSGVDFTSLDSSYKEFFIEWNGIYCSDSTTFDFRFNADSGSNYDCKGFQSLGASVSGVEKGGTSTYGTPGMIGTHIASNNFVNTSRGWLHVYNPTGTSSNKTYKHMSAYYDGGAGWRVTQSVGYYNSTSAISQINIVRIAGSGTISTLTNGGIRIWGGK